VVPNAGTTARGRDGTTVTTGTTHTRHATLRYTSMRVSVFAACVLVLWLIAMTGVVKVRGTEGVVLLFGVAALISAPISYVVLNRQRDAMSAEIVGKVEQTRQRLAENRSQEDEADDAARSRSAQSPAES
jgi:Protein of unknown function (DUF4229)